MDTRRSARITRRSAARALDGTGTSGSNALDHVLAAATAPPRGSEVDTEAAATAQFRAAFYGPTPVAARPRAAQRVIARLAAAKMVVAGVTTLFVASAGFALAASTGTLPEALGGAHRSAHEPTRSPRLPSRTEHQGSRPGHGHSVSPPSAGETGGPSTPVGPPSPTALPTPSFEALCRAYQATSGNHNGHGQDDPSFTPLTIKAGGPKKVAAYCEHLVGSSGGHSGDTSGRPSPSAQSSQGPQDNN